MNLLFAQLTEIITALALIAILFTLNYKSSKSYIGNLLRIFICYGVLIIISFIRDQFFSLSIFNFLIFLILYISTFFSLQASFIFFEIKIPKIAYLFAAILYIFMITIFRIFNIQPLAEGFGYLLLGISLIFLGIQWAIRQILNSGRSKAIGVVFIILGILFIAFIPIQTSDWLFILGYYFAAFLEMLLTFFIVKAYFIETLDSYHSQNDKYLNFFENSSDAILLFDHNGILECNTRTSEIFQYSKEEIIGKLPSYFSPVYQANGKKSKEYETLLLNQAMLGQTQRFEWIHKAKDGSEVFCEVALFKIGENTTGALIRDVSATVANKEALNFHKNYDALTKLPKRSLFIDRLDRALEYSQNIIALLALDIDNFKGINVQYGHDFGDQVLIKITQLIRSALGDHVTMTRLGGDEFVILLEDLPNQEKIVQIITKIEKIFIQELNINGTLINTGVCIGVVFPDDKTNNSTTLIKNADLALNQAKKKGRGKIEFYSKASYDMFNSRINLEKEMIEGIKNNEFIPHFQPIIDLKTNKIIGAEALMRWNRSDGKQIFPDVFIPISEDTSLIIEMGETILRQSCLACLELLKYMPQFIVNVNLSPVQLQSSDIVNTIKKVLNETGLPARHLEVEITESILIEDEEIATDTLMKIRHLGVLVSLDDFGTGYSSLSYLDRLHVDTVKIDRVFIVNIPRNKRANSMLESIIKLVHNLDYKIVAEGVEEEDQVNFIKSLGCDKIQGYYYYRPMPFEELLNIVGSKKSQ